MEFKNMTKEYYFFILDKYDDCSICAMNKRVSAWVRCPGCDFSCCRTCLKKYLLGTNNMTPDCMSCHKQWDFEFLANNIDSDFHNKVYRNHRAKILQELESSLLPDTQPFVKEEQSKYLLVSKINILVDENRVYKTEINRLETLYNKNKNDINSMERNQRQHVWEVPEVPEDEKKEKKVLAKYIASCPRDDCNGYVSDGWKCGLCDKYVCSQCHLAKTERIDTDHVCNPDDVATATLLRKDTKPCPKCYTPINKILGGCEQMYCVVCNTAFSWITGEVDKGRIHNPHYYEFQRQQNNGVIPRVQGDVQQNCEHASLYDITRTLNKLHVDKRGNSNGSLIINAHRVIQHIRHVVLNNYPDTLTTGTHLDLRVKYLMNLIDKKKWLSELKKREKKREKDRAINMALTMFVSCLEDMMNNIRDASTLDILLKIFLEMQSLRKYVNNELIKTQNRFNNIVPKITKYFEVSSLKDESYY
jgi:hypothetical protein